MNGKTALAILLIGAGVLILLNKLGWVVGSLFGFLFPILLIVLGVIGIKNKKMILGGILLGFGFLMLMGKLAWILGWLVAIAFIAYGISLLRRKPYAP